jgi:hypothetical protein
MAGCPDTKLRIAKKMKNKGHRNAGSHIHLGGAGMGFACLN